jgi:branched-chain amino acid transport system permease protein
MLSDIFTLILDGLLLGSVYAVFSLGLSLQWGVMGTINAAHGELYTLGAILVLFFTYSVHPILAIVLSMLVMFGLGVTIDQSIFRPLRKRTQIDKMPEKSVIVTIALSILLLNFYLATLGGDFWRQSVSYVSGNVNIFGIEYPLNRILIAGFCLLITAGVALFLKITRTGKAIRAVAQDREKAMIVGINTERIYLMTWGISALLAGASGALIAPIFVIQPMMGVAILTYGFLSTQIGGMGSLIGTTVASYLIAIVTNFAGFYISNVYKEVFAFVIMFVVLLIKGGGLFEKSQS